MKMRGRLPCLQLVNLSSYVNNLQQINNIYNNSGKILDLILTDVPSYSISRSSDILCPEDPYHPALDISFTIDASTTLKLRRTSKLDFYKADYTVIRNYLDEFDWYSLLGDKDVDEMTRKFYDILYETIQRFVPQCKNRSGRYPVWFSRTLIRSLHKKDKLRRRLKVFKNPLDMIELDFLNADCKKLSRSCFNNYIEKI